MERKKSEEFVKKERKCMLVKQSPRRRGRLVVRWKDWVKEYIYKRVADRKGRIEPARRERWRLFCRGHHFGRHFRRDRGVRDYR